MSRLQFLAAILVLSACGRPAPATYYPPTTTTDPGTSARGTSGMSVSGFTPVPLTSGYAEGHELKLFLGNNLAGDCILMSPWGPIDSGVSSGSVGVAADGSRSCFFNFSGRVPESFDLFGPAAAELLDRAWELRINGASYSWVPSSLEGGSPIRGALGAVLGLDPTAVLEGPPPDLKDIQLRAEPGGILQPDRPTRFILSMRNHGPGAASRVRAVTKSADISLHGIGFSVGLVPGGGGFKERQLTVVIPPNISSTEVTIVVVIEEGRGFVPAPAAFRFAVANDPLSCSGKITRAEFDAKMAKLKALLDDGTLKPDDYRRYEAVNLACLE